MDGGRMLRTPPHDVSAEQSVLGGLLLAPAQLDRVEALIAEDDFYRRDHRLIFRAIAELSRKGTPPDAVTLGEWLGNRGTLDDVGGLDYLIELASTTPSAANVTAYAEIVRDKSHRRRVIEHATELVNQAYDGSGDTPDNLIDAAVGRLMALQKVQTNAEWTLKQAFKLAHQRISAAYYNKGQLPGIPTGLSALDKHLGGLHDSDLTVIGGRPAMGKTAKLFGMARHAAREVGPVAIVSGEQPAVQLGMRMLALASGVSGSSMRNGKLDEAEWAKLTAGITSDCDLPIFVLDRSSPTIGEVMRYARRMKREHGIRALYVDYIQRLEAPGEKRWEKVTAIAKGLKTIARELNIPVIALSQVNRGVEARADKRPRMSDLSDASEIEKEADQVLLLYRDEYYNPDSKDKGTAEIIIDKNRHGETAFCRVAWMAHLMRFADLDPGYRREESPQPESAQREPPRKARSVPARTYASETA